MALSLSGFHLLLFSGVFTLIFTLPSVRCLLPSDGHALLLVLGDLGFRQPPERSLCDSAGVFCERRGLNDSFSVRATRLVFESHRLNGRLSLAIGQLSELKELSLRNCQLAGLIPSQISGCRMLEILDLRGNRLSGEIPTELSSLTRLRILDLSGNKFSGDLKFLKYFRNLEKLNLSGNMFAGEVPKSLISFPNLRLFDVSGNKLLDGSIRLPLTNQLDEDFHPARYVFAESPQTKNQTTELRASSPTSDAASASPSASPGKHKKGNRKIVSWIIGFAAGAVAGCGSGLVFTLLFKLVSFLVKGRRNARVKIFSPMIKDPEDLAFLETEDGLLALDVIGRGGCGEVYKAVLPGSDGKEIAVKKISQPQLDSDNLAEEDSRILNKMMRQIKSEIVTVGQIRHRNLLPLLAHLPRPDCHYLVYEYMKNGSLQDYLQQVAEGRRELDWLARYKIALGLASGLEYLHFNHSPRIIHRDLKPANILLDDEMEARIADFGLAKAVPDAHTHVTTTNVAGTMGYISPEYHQTSKFTDKTDIYSFGVVLAILVIGKFPSDQFFQHTDEVSLVKWMKNLISSEDPRRAIDPRLLGNGYEEQMLLVLKVACFCTVDNPKERPNSKDARVMLSQIKH